MSQDNNKENIHESNEPSIILDEEDNLEMLSKPTKEKISIWRKREGAKLKDLHGKDKVKYIFAYYYQWMVVAAAVIFIIYVGCFIAYRKSFNTRLNVIIFDAEKSNAAEYLEEVVPDYFEFGKKDKLSVDASMSLNKSFNGTYNESNAEIITETANESESAQDETGSTEDSIDMVVKMKVTSMGLSKAIDIVIGDEKCFTGFACESGLVLDVTEYLPDDIYELVEDDLIYGINSDGEEKAVAIKVPEEFAEKLGLPYEPYVSIGSSTNNEQDSVNFIRMIYGLDYAAYVPETQD